MNIFLILVALFFSSSLHASEIYRFLNTVELNGRIEKGDARKFDDIIDSKVRKLRIKSIGGLNVEAKDIARTINEKSISIEVKGYCASSCAEFVFLSAHFRKIQSNSFLAFHGGAAKVAVQVVALLKEKALRDADPDLENLAKNWESEAEKANNHIPTSFDGFGEVLRRVHDLTTPRVDSIDVDKVNKKVVITGASPSSCDYWVPSGETLRDIGIVVDWRGEPDLSDIAKVLNVPESRLFRGNPLDPNFIGCS